MPPRLYGDLAAWYPLVTRAEDYAEEAVHLLRVINSVGDGGARTLLELGCGAGHMASHLKKDLDCTLTDLSEDMLALSRDLNPACTHVAGDMRDLRLGRTFDAVLLHDAVAYMTSEDDLRAAIDTVAAHLRPGGVALLVPDDIEDTYEARCLMGGYDVGARSLRYLEWASDLIRGEKTVTVDFVFALRDGHQPARVEHDSHVVGVFDRATWTGLMEAAGLTPVPVSHLGDPFPDDHTVFAGRKASGRP